MSLDRLIPSTYRVRISWFSGGSCMTRRLILSKSKGVADYWSSCLQSCQACTWRHGQSLTWLLIPVSRQIYMATSQSRVSEPGSLWSWLSFDFTCWASIGECDCVTIQFDILNAVPVAVKMLGIYRATWIFSRTKSAVTTVLSSLIVAATSIIIWQRFCRIFRCCDYRCPTILTKKYIVKCFSSNSR